MNKHSCAARLLAMLLCVLMVMSAFTFTAFADEAVTDEGSTESVATLAELLAADKYKVYSSRYADSPRATKSVTIDATQFVAEHTTAVIGDGAGEVHVGTYSNIDRDGNEVAGTAAQGVYCPEEGAVGWVVNIPETGKYSITVEYYPVEGKPSGIERTLYIDGVVPFYEARFLTCTKSWGDIYAETYTGERAGAFQMDITGNEIRANKRQTPQWRSYQFSDSTGNYTDPFEFYIEAGEHVIQLEAQREAYALKSITFHPYEELDSYEDYMGGYSDADKVNTDVIAQENDGETAILIEAEMTENTSDQSIFAFSDRSSSISSPQDISRERYNALGDEKWNTIGQWASWKVTVPKSGLYKIAVRYRQNVNAGLFSSRVLRVNGEIPFAEAKGIRFDPNDTWETCYLSDGSEQYKDGFYIYLNEGENLIELEAALGSMSEIVLRLNEVVRVINASYTEILKITGAVPDSYRDYGFYNLIPDSIDDLAAMSDEVYSIIDRLTAISGKSENITTLENIARRLQKMGHKEDEVAKNLDGLKGDIGSLGTWLQTAMTQPLALDYISVQGADCGEEELPVATENFLSSLWFEVRMFVMSFIADYNTLGALEEVADENSIVVWTSSGRDQAKIIRNLVNNNYTPETGVHVSLKLISGGTLLPSILAGVGPDVALDGADIIDWAIRGAITPLNDFEGYDEIIAEFPDAATVPLTLYTDNIENYSEETHGEITMDQVEAKTYGLPMTMDFAMMFYRADIFMQMGLEVPDTWDDFYTILPILQNNNMTVALPTSSGGLNMFLYQMLPEDATILDGLYADNGRRINLDSNLALQAFDELCSLFTQYKVPVSANFENQFRTGEIPLGITSYGNYTQLSVFAPEIKGLWEFRPLPGWADENGNINNAAVATVSSICMPRDNNRSPERAQTAFDFMAWYVGEENQTNYASEYTAWMGQGTKYSTANIAALKNMPWTTNEYRNLMAQFENVAAIPEYPGVYMISRNVDFAFMDAVNNNADPVMGLLDYITDINKELSRKRKEFGLDYYEITTSSNFAESIER